MKFIPAYLEAHTIEAVDLIAKHNRVPRSAVVREIIEQYVARASEQALHNTLARTPNPNDRISQGAGR